MFSFSNILKHLSVIIKHCLIPHCLYNKLLMLCTGPVLKMDIYHSSTEGFLRCFQVLATMNKTANIYPCLGFCVNISLQLLGVNTKKDNCWITWESMLTLVRKHPTVFQCSCTIVHCCQQQTRVPVLHVFIDIWWCQCSRL